MAAHMPCHESEREREGERGGERERDGERGLWAEAAFWQGAHCVMGLEGFICYAGLLHN
jgi:hypothetical protein